jgi:hypothetical protein
MQSASGLPAASQTANPNDAVSLFATVSNDFSNLGVSWSLSGAGSLTGSGSFFTTYVAPPSVTAPTTATITAASVKYPSVTTNLQITVLPSGAGPNVAIINVNNGPAPGQVKVNGAFTSVTLCNQNSTTTCQTVDGILVDTGSYGLRILQSAIPLLKLPAFTDPLGNTLENCVALPDGSFLWGPVTTADMYISGEAASTLTGPTAQIQLISSTLSIVPDSCSNGGIADNTPQLLGANGILGIGPEPTDCTLSGINYCDGSQQSAPPNLYYACPSTGCSTSDSPVLVGAAQQVSNPVILFSPDTNGVIIQLPPVSDPQASAIGIMTFGIETQSGNNSLGAATVFTLDSNNNFTTIFNGQTLTNSFLDSGSNALLFPDSLPGCTVNTQFYCPPSSESLSATINGGTPSKGAMQGTATVSVTVDNADSLFSSYPQDSVFLGLTGPEGIFDSCSNGNISCVFNWGLPFFYGRAIYVAIDGQPAPPGTPPAPWWAY